MWGLHPEHIILPNHRVHVWQIGLEQPEETVDQLSRLLSVDEARRAGRFTFEKDRVRHTVAHAALRIILELYCELPAGQIRFGTQAKGKPFIQDCESNRIQFNLTHSHNLALVAITRQHAIGVDIEYVRPLDDLERLASRNFSRSEYEQVRSLEAPSNLQAFFNAWTRKEAYLKAMGDGLYQPLDSFDVTLLPGEPARLVSIAGSQAAASEWTVYTIDSIPGYIGAVVVKGRRNVIEGWQWMPERELNNA